MAWSAFDTLARVGLAAGSAPACGVDPYWVWAEATGWREFVLDMPAVGRGRVSFIGQLADGCTLASLQAEAAAAGCALELPPVYARSDLAESDSPFFTGRVARAGLPLLAQLRSLARWELGTPVRPAVVQDAVTDAVTDGVTDAVRGALGRAVGPASSAPAQRPPATQLLGLIDDGVAFLHRQFRGDAGSGGPRWRLLWDQGVAASGPLWHTPDGFGYGRQASAAALADALAARAALPAPDERVVYRAWNYLLGPRPLAAPRAVWRATHGTHVLHVAAGRDDPLDVGGAPPDAAAASELAFVGLPDTTVSDSSGGSLPVHVLDALRAVLAECSADAAVVVSLSYGCQGGPHDGSSLLERAMDDLLARRCAPPPPVKCVKAEVPARPPRLTRSAIVISAGNSARTRSHASAQVRRDAPARWVWQVPAGDTTDSFVEVWYRAVPGVTLTLSVTPPGGAASGPVPPGQAAQWQHASGRTVAALVHQARVPTGGDAMALLALAPTAPRDREPGAAAGNWLIEVGLVAAGAPVDAAGEGAAEAVAQAGAEAAAQADAKVEVHAYIERDDPVPGSAKPASRFTHAGSAATAAGTLNGIATGRHVFVAGGCVQGSDRAAGYSSLGPTRDGRHGLPHALAACERSAAQPGVRAAAVRSADTLLMNGTSVAAPMLARRLLNLLATGHHIDIDDLAATVARLATPAPTAGGTGSTGSTGSTSVTSGPAAPPSSPPSSPPSPPRVSGRRRFTTSSAGS